MDDDVDWGLKWIVRGASFMIVGTLLGKALTYLYRILVARYLGTADYGQLSLALTVFYISMTFATVSTEAGVKRFVSKYLGREEPGKIAGTIRSALTLSVPLSLVTAVGLFVAAPAIASRGFGNPSLTLYIRVFSIAIPFQGLYNVFSSVAAAYRRVEFLAVVDEVYKSAATLVVTAALLLAGYGLMGAVLAQVFALASASLIIVYLVESRLISILRQNTEGFRNHRAIIRYSAPLFMSGIIGQITGWTDTVMLGFFDTASSVGVYNAALPTAKVLTVFGALGSNLFPVVSELYEKGEKERAVDITSVSVKWIFSATFPLMLIMVAFAGPVLKFLFTGAYLGGSVALAVLSVAFFTQTITSYAGAYIGVEERTKLSFYNSVVTAGANVVLNWLLIPYFKEVGVASTGAGVATAVSLALGSLLAVVEVYYLFDVQPYRIRRLLPPLAAAATAAGIMYALVNAVYDVTPVWVMAPAFIGFIILYAVFFLLFGGLEEEDIEMLKALEDKTGREFPLLKSVIRKIAR
ncbi:MAG: flippase [Candidatus Nanohaloarchaea archaeon]